MNAEQSTAIKAYCEGAYPQMREKLGGDEVWYDVLKDYRFEIMLKVVKGYIKSGNEFPPSLGSLCKNYENERDSLIESVIARMDDAGEFDDEIGTPSEIASFNRKSRMNKIRLLYGDKNAPEWMKLLFRKYSEIVFEQITSHERRLT